MEPNSRTIWPSPIETTRHPFGCCGLIGLPEAQRSWYTSWSLVEWPCWTRVQRWIGRDFFAKTASDDVTPSDGRSASDDAISSDDIGPSDAVSPAGGIATPDG